MEPIESSAGPQPVEVAFSGPEPQRRLTVAFRLLLVIPHIFVLFFVGIAVYVVVIVGWFAALVLGRLPAGMADFITGVVRYATRVYAYANLLTDRYPPFTLAAADYPVAVTTYPGRLNRLAVLFRLVLMIPAYIVVGLVSSGLGIVMFFGWLIVLVAGRMPPSLHQAVAAVLRYQTRYYTYLALISAAYPSGLFGDQPALPTTPGLPPTEAGVSQYGTGPFSAEQHSADRYSVLPPPSAAPPLASRLVLTQAARRIVVTFLVLGVLSYGGYIAVYAVAIAGSVGRVEAYNTLNADYRQLTQAANQFETTARNCAGSGGISCAEPAARDLSGAFSSFAQEVQGLSVPAADRGDADALVNDANGLAAVLDRMASAPGQAEYLAAAGQFQNLAGTFDRDYQTLAEALLSG